MCVCVCVCVCTGGSTHKTQSPGKIKRREVSWTLTKKVRLICGSRPDQEELGGAGPSREPRRDQEQGRWWSWAQKVGLLLLQLLLNSSATEIVLVTTPHSS